VYNHHCNICNDIPIYFYNILVKYLKHTYETFETLKHALTTCGRPGPGDSSRRGRSRRHASTTTTTIASRTGLGSTGWATWDGRAVAARRSGRAGSGQGGHGWTRPPRWRRPAAGSGGLEWACGSEERKYRCIFFIFFGETAS
jgi:hypothetical protein